MKLIWIENEIDKKYISELAQQLLDKLDYKIFYRPTKTIYNNYQSFLDGDTIDEFSSIDDVLEFIFDHVTVIVTGYNLNKYDSKYFVKLKKLVLLGHSHLGPVRYNRIAYLTSKMDNSMSIVPSYYFDLFKTKLSARDLSKIVKVDNYYKNDYHISNPPRVQCTNSILVLPHWSTSIKEIEEIVVGLRKTYDNPIIVKYHPNVKLELLKAKKFILGTKVGEKGSSRQAQKALDDFNLMMKAEYNCSCYYEDEMTLLDAIDQSSHLVFDGASTSLVESMIRDYLYSGDIKKKFVIYENKSNKELFDEVNKLLNERPNMTLKAASQKVRNMLGLRNWISYGEVNMISNSYKIGVVSNGNYNFEEKFSEVDHAIISKIVVGDGKSANNEIINLIKEL